MGSNIANGRPITDLIGELQQGNFLHDTTEAVYEIMQAVMDTRKCGQLTMTITFAPTGKGTVEVASTFKTKVPEHDQPTTSFFVGKDYALHRHDPAQTRMDLRAVDDQPSVPREVYDRATGEIQSVRD